MNNNATTMDQLEMAVARSASEVSRAAASDMEQLGAAKSDKPKYGSFTLPTTGWTEDDSTEEYTVRYDLTVAGVTENDRATVVVIPSGEPAARECGLCGANQTMTNKIRFLARTVPATPIPAVYWLDQGRSN